MWDSADADLKFIGCIEGQGYRERWNPTSRKKRARCGAPVLCYGTRGLAAEDGGLHRSPLGDAALAGAGDFLGARFLENRFGASDPIMIVSMHREQDAAFSQPRLIALG